MEISPRATRKVEEYEGYQDHARVRSSINIVQDRLTQGLLTRDKILSRFTQQVRLELEDDEDPQAPQNITKWFEHLQDASSNLDQEKFKTSISGILHTLQPRLANIPLAVDALVHIFNWHAAYPFPIQPSQGPGSPPALNEAAFTRAVALLTLEPRVTGAPQLAQHAARLTAQASHGVTTSLNDPTVSVSFVTYRGRDAHDFRRWLFRSLAEPKRDSGDRPPVRLPVPRVVLTPEPTRADADYDDRRIWYMTPEDERGIDLTDVVADTMPGCRKPMPNPTRDKCALALPTLPRHELGLNDLHVRPEMLHALAVLASGLKLAYETQLAGLDVIGERQEDVEHPDIPAKTDLSWGDFDSVLGSPDYTETIASGLDYVFRSFKTTRV